MEIGRFLVVGALNFVFTFALFTFALKFLAIGYIAALFCAWIAGNILTYILNFNWVFRPEEKLQFRWRFVKYLTAGALSFSFNALAISVLVELARLDPFWAQVWIMPFIVVINFVAAKYWSLRKSKNHI